MSGCAAPPPVIAIDGPTASGKGTVAQRVARALGWHYLDSGSLYRLTALGALRGMAGPEALAGAAGVEPVPTGAEPAIAAFAARLPAIFDGERIFLGDADATESIRDEAVGNAASRIATMPAVRAALVECQRAFRRAPGLVADGRDMGTVIFPDAELKIFLTATPQARAERRYKQLIEKGFSASLSGLLRDLEERDRRDASRAIAPLAPARDAQVVDSTALGIDETAERVLGLWDLRRRR